MDIRAFFLADDRVVPENYRHVLVNPLKINWPSLGQNYKEVITMAVDAEGAEGHAFVTEYAGSSDVVNPIGVLGPGWDANALVDLGPAGVVYELETQGLMACDLAECQFGHPLVEGILAELMPAPDGVSNAEFWDCPECYLHLWDPATFDSVALAGAFDERIIAPGQHAIELLDAFPYLTRMYTTISPGEMTVDPLFHQNPSLEDVAAVRTATQRRLCNGDSVWILPDGREVFVPNGQPWPAFSDQMPWEEDVEEIMDAGAPLMLVDRTEEIDAMLAEYNAAQGWPASGSDGEDGGSTTGDDDPFVDSAGADQDDRAGNGCACRAASGARWAPFALLLGVPLLRPGRRRRRG
jgi:hypothetical protein